MEDDYKKIELTEKILSGSSYNYFLDQVKIIKSLSSDIVKEEYLEKIIHKFGDNSYRDKEYLAEIILTMNDESKEMLVEKYQNKLIDRGIADIIKSIQQDAIKERMIEKYEDTIAGNIISIIQTFKDDEIRERMMEKFNLSMGNKLYIMLDMPYEKIDSFWY